MKIIFCINSIISSGGMERVVINRANYLVRKYNYDVFIITTENNSKLFKDKKMFFCLEPKVKVIDLGINYYDTMLDLNKSMILKKIIIKSKKSEHLKKLSIKIKELKPEIVISMGDMSRGIVSKLRYNCKKILENHFSKENFVGKEKSLLNFYKNYKEKKLMAKYDEIIVLTEKDKKKWNNSRIKVLPNFLSFLPLDCAKLEEKKAIAIGRLSSEKGFDVLINIWAEVIKYHKDWLLDIYGDGELKEVLKQQIQNLKLEGNVFLKGFSKEIEKNLMNSSIYIMTSQIESFGLVLIEAASCGIPVIAFSGSDGPEEIIKNGENGFLCEKMNCKDMISKIIYLIENKDVRKKMGKNAREIAFEKYSEDKIMEKWLELILFKN